MIVSSFASSPDINKFPSKVISPVAWISPYDFKSVGILNIPVPGPGWIIISSLELIVLFVKLNEAVRNSFITISPALGLPLPSTSPIVMSPVGALNPVLFTVKLPKLAELVAIMLDGVFVVPSIDKSNAGASSLIPIFPFV